MTGQEQRQLGDLIDPVLRVSSPRESGANTIGSGRAGSGRQLL